MSASDWTRTVSGLPVGKYVAWRAFMIAVHVLALWALGWPTVAIASCVAVSHVLLVGLDAFAVWHDSRGAK